MHAAAQAAQHAQAEADWAEEFEQHGEEFQVDDGEEGAPWADAHQQAVAIANAVAAAAQQQQQAQQQPQLQPPQPPILEPDPWLDEPNDVM